MTHLRRMEVDEQQLLATTIDDNFVAALDIEKNDKEEWLAEEELSIDTTNNNKTRKSCLKSKWRCRDFGTVSLLLTFLILWLAESQFSEGVLRRRYVGEECGYRLIGSTQCSPKLVCMTRLCQLPLVCSTDAQTSTSPTMYSNRTAPCPKCPDCPSVRPKLVTYFDFDEGPNRWLDPGPHGFYKYVRHLPYGGCKELCASEPECAAVSYQGPAMMCHLMKQYHFPAPVNNTWNYAIKVV